jgi:TetR/AcrR family transcriptional repressor of nem operon
MGRKGDTRLRLIEAANDLIWQQSYGQVTIDHICARTDLNKGSFYHFFESKADLTLAALDEIWRQRKEELNMIFSPLNPPLERIKQYCESIQRRQELAKEKAGRVLGCLHFALGAEMSTRDSRIRDKINDILGQVVKYIESAVQDAMAEDLVEVNDVKKAARRIFIYVEGTLTQARIQNDLGPISQLYPEILEILRVKQAATPTG